jgi:hypothetical protein
MCASDSILSGSHDTVKRDEAIIFSQDGGQPPMGTIIPGDYLSMKEDKTDWILQLLHY